ncbi:glucoamylase family protein [Luteimonas notoginsengisoli]|uniref:Glucoamylase family protein n=1 Tax=Luteimonas notoginsengisoli TaxID=1578200 RepID=A0ABV7UVC5_9GAMM
MRRRSFSFAMVWLACLILPLAACKKIDEPEARSSVPQQQPAEPAAQPQPPPPEPEQASTGARPVLPPLFKDIEKRTFQFFWDTTNETNGMTPDRFPSRPFASIASIGFALTAYPIGIENGWVSRRQAVDRTLTTLEFLRDAKMGPQKEGTSGYHGFYYHFLDMQKGQRYEPWVELSSVDTGLLMMGVLFSRGYYDRDDPREEQIRKVADELYRRVEWNWLQVRPPLISMGWYPETGFIEHDWTGSSEGMLVYLLALGSPTHPIEPDVWQAWTAGYEESWGHFEGQEYLSYGPMFWHQYNQVWVDFRGIQDEYMRAHGIDYFENSRRATLAQRTYAIENPMKWQGYGENVWGLTASDGPQRTVQLYNGEEREFRHYSARGAGLRDAYDDGTIAPTAAIGSLVFAPEVVIPATVEMHERYGDFLYSSYGFLDSFNPSFNYDIPLKTGRLVPDKGWVASDYIGIDQGPILTMIANYRNEFVWNVMRRDPYIRAGLERAGFTGGWLDAEQDKPQVDADASAPGQPADRAGNGEPAPVRPPLKAPRAAESNLQSQRIHCQHAPIEAIAATSWPSCIGKARLSRHRLPVAGPAVGLRTAVRTGARDDHVLGHGVRGRTGRAPAAGIRAA